MTKNTFFTTIDLNELSKSGATFKLEANAEDRLAIAQRLQIPAVKELLGTLSVRATRQAIFVKGELTALLTRECVASLEHFDETVTESFDVKFLRAEPDELPEEMDDVEAVHADNDFDIGDFLVQQTALAMSPFPRLDSAESLTEKYGRQSESSPFDVLREIAEKDQ